MVEVIKAEISEALAKKFRKRAMEIYGYRKGAVKAALENLLTRFVSSGKADWSILRGSIQSRLTSVELQHKVWERMD
ncbi:MAG: hypothetical protein QW238_00640 [Candidatus Bathyarchaeia archaeon]